MSANEITVKMERDEDDEPVVHPPTNTYAGRMPPNRHFCAAFACMNSSDNNNLKFFPLPTDPQRRENWLQLIRREDLIKKSSKRYYVCETHFRKEDIKVKGPIMVVADYAVPALCLPGRLQEGKETQTYTDDIPRSYSVFTQTCPDTKFVHTQTNVQLLHSLPYCQKLKSDLKTTKLKLAKVKSKFNAKRKEIFSKLCDKYLSKELSELVKAQVNLKEFHCGNRYTLEYKLFCFKLYHTSPDAYHLLSKTLKLPSKETITRISIPVTSEITDDLLSILKNKVQSMSDAERNCTVVIGTMGLKASLWYSSQQDKIVGFHEVDGVQSPRPATSALVMIIRGLFCDYSQPVGYALLSKSKDFEDVLKWINKILTKLIDIGLHVRAFVSDLASARLIEAISIRRKVSSSKPYFYVNGRKIYFILDAPYLLKLLRNKLLHNDFHFQDSVAKFQHIQDFYNQDSQKCFKVAPELTNSHINPSTGEKKNINYARELLSKKVAAGINTYVNFHAIDESGKETARFISMIDDLLDALSSSPTQEPNGYKRAFCGDEIQLGFFNEMLELFQSLKIINSKSGNDVSSEAGFIEEFEIIMKSVLQLFHDLKVEGHTSLYTCRLHNDVHHDFIEQMRAQIGKTRKPTCRMFVIGFMTIFVSNILKSKKGDDISDAHSTQHLESVFLEIRRIREMRDEPDKKHLNTSEKLKETSVQVAKSDYDKLLFPEDLPLLNICAHLLKQCLDHHKDCAALRSYLKLDIENYNYFEDLNFKYYKDVSMPLLVIPPDNFVAYVEKMEHKFQEIIQSEHLCVKICDSMHKALSEIPPWTPCPCFPHTYLIKLFVMAKISNIIRMNNNASRSIGKNAACRFS
ncbi:uncharacterized protein LOC113230978 [Hyposmocoma kahamanoa]|uniref:uncharacterized protein LOC113230978 n=1 Tax=Hyposmocoma kahamanoa TaxID=1477025 RepID=UPI000E6D6FAB|nr:uncharacterized protein LOC113230978 [Hyposmocoma kahamanoa]